MKCAIQYCCIIPYGEMDQSQQPSDLLSAANKYAIYHPDEEVFPEDVELDGYVAIVRTGLVASQFKHPKHHEFIESIYFPRDLIEFNSRSEHSKPLSFKSMDTTNLCFFKFDLLKNQEKLYISYLEKRSAFIAEVLSFNKAVLVEYNAEKRVVLFLLYVIDKKGLKGHDDVEFKINLTRLQIGFCIGLAEETIVRAIRNLVKNGLIKVKGKCFFIPCYQVLVDYI